MKLWRRNKRVEKELPSFLRAGLIKFNQRLHNIANFLQQKANESIKKLIFLIGGVYGVDEVIFKRANHTWSLSKLVFPHMLVRLMLAEQLYRACTILKNEKYHHP